ncbi:agmatinase [Arvimicrobium flavum]|uniref:agmatinase n=1 Tax=Arvimicrobium flavum TaxID=3393320 RepID=UPI00237A5BCF|nr:agmatinase [Mesorhizobium shangrilense]
MSRIHRGDQAFDHDSLYGTEVEMPFSGARSFMRRRQTRDLAGVDYAIMGIPYDLSTSGRPGARLGPDALRRATSQLSWGEVWPWNFDPFDRLAVVDYGDVFYQRGQPQEMLQNAYAQALHVLKAGTRLIGLGGDHLTTYPLLKAHAEVHGPLALIQFDAHRDTMKSSFLDHGSYVRFAMDEGLIDPAKSIQVGIRTFYDLDDPIIVLHRPWVRQHGIAALVAEIERVTDGMPCYLTFDIDCIDPAFAPGTGTPVVDGLLPHEAIDTIRALTNVNIVGMDVVEVAPPYDPTETTALLGASVILEHLCARASLAPENKG